MVHVNRHNGRVARKRLSCSVLALCVSPGLLALASCNDEPLSAPPSASNRGNGGPTVAIEAQAVESGFALGNRRKSIEVASFRISQHPVTQGEFRACIEAGRCKTPLKGICADALGAPVTHRPNFHEQGLGEDVALTCPGLQEARQYCTWVGGTLPTLEQWLLAARGPSPRRFPWGELLPKCAEHPFGLPETRAPDARCSSVESSAGRVGQHPAGSSVMGVQDILLTRGELLELSEASHFLPCRPQPGQPDRACVVTGMAPGSIDSVLEARPPADGVAPTLIAYGFRCVWGG